MKKIHITAILTLALVLSPAFLQAQQGQGGWTLRQCVDYAIEHNIVIKRSANSVELEDINVSTAKWARLPNLSGSVSQDFRWGRTSTPVKNEETGNYDQVYVNTSSQNTGFSLGTNIPLFTGFELPNQLSLAKLNLKASIADLEKAKDDLALNVASAYVQVLYDDELNKIAKEQVELAKIQLDRIIKLQEVGKAAPVEVAELRASLAQDEMSLVQADNKYRLSLLALSQLLELPTPEGFYIATPDEDVQFSELTAPDEIFLTAVTEKPAIRAAQLRLEGSEKSIKIAQSAYYPTLNLNGNLGSGYYSTLTNRNFRQQLGDNFSKYIGLSLNIPIFNRLATRNSVRTARVRQMNYSLELDEEKKDMYKEIQQAWYNALASEAKYNASNVAVDSNQEAFRLMTEKYENGKATFIEFNESRLNLMRSLSDQVQAKYEYVFQTKVLDFYKGIPID